MWIFFSLLGNLKKQEFFLSWYFRTFKNDQNLILPPAAIPILFPKREEAEVLASDSCLGGDH